DIAAQRAIATSVPRGEVEAALRAEGEPELTLRILGTDEDERHTISMEWSRGDLEDLLARASAEHVVLRFDRDELACAFDDVEAHGLRRHALVFAVAAAGALGAGAGAQAMESAAAGGGAPVAAPSTTAAPVEGFTDASSAGGYAAASVDATAASASSFATDASSGGGYPAPVPESESRVTDVSSTGG